MPASYVIPLRWERDDGLAELAGYAQRLAQHLEVIVVDGSSPAAFARHAAAFGPSVGHRHPHADLHYRFGKVNNVISGLREAHHDRVVIADDDVRYELAEIRRVLALLDHADLVVPQNYFDPAPWHARWDTGRSLLNRALGGDFPGTLAVRRSRLPAWGYDGDVLFENLELMRTVAAAGGIVVHALDLFVRRLPPTGVHFWSQRVRQAYDDFALPVRMAMWLALGPLTAIALAVGRWRAVALGVGLTIAIAEAGRRRAGGSAVYPATAALWAPLWLAERAVTSWLAVHTRLVRGGVRYGDMLLSRAATPPRQLRRRLGGLGGSWSTLARAEPHELVGAVAEGTQT